MTTLRLEERKLHKEQKQFKPSREKKQPFSIKVQTVDGSIEWVPWKTNSTDACFNIKAKSFIDIYGEDQDEQNEYLLEPDERVLAKTGFILNLTPGWEAQIRTKMSFAIKIGLSVLDSPGTVDSSFKDEIGVILVNNGEQDINLSSGAEIAQMVITRVPYVKLWHVPDINKRY